MDVKTHRARVFELAPVSVCEAVLARDCRRLGQIPMADATLNYYVGINTWVSMVADWCGSVYQNILDAMSEDGLIPIILRFSEAADSLIQGDDISDPLVCDVLSRLAVFPHNVPWVRQLNNPVLTLKLEICRYLKRFSMPFPKCKEDAIRAFSETQVKVAQEWEFHPDAMSPGREIALVWAARELDAIPWDRIYSIFDSIDNTARTFTPGAAVETGRNMARKLRVMWDQNPQFFRPVFGSFGVEMPVPSTPQPCWTDTCATRAFYPSSEVREHVVKVSTAPKNAKLPRIIALEPLQAQTTTKWIQERLYDIPIPGMDLRDQTINQDLAIAGSRDGSFATIDLSSASDYVSKGILRYLLPDYAFECFTRYAPTHWVRDDSPIRVELSSFATMGNGLTFWVESLVFWAIARGAVRSVGGNPDEVSVYGDDIIVPGPCYGVVVNSLEHCGFVVNRSKSFGHGFFRESCGVEALHGEVIPSVYYPRFPLSGEVTEHTCTLHGDVDFVSPTRVLSDSTSRLVQLQHRLYPLSLRASRFVTAVVQDACPEMTVSVWGDDSVPDLWGSTPVKPTAPALYGKVVKAGYRGWNGKWVKDATHAEIRPVYYGPGFGQAVLRAPLFEDDSWTMTAYPVVKRHGAVDTVARALQQSLSYWAFLQRGPVPLYPEDTAKTMGYAPGCFMSQPSLSPDEMLKTPSVSYKLRRTT